MKKKILVQLDSDQHPSTFDAIVAHDAGIDALLSYGGVTPDRVKDLVQSVIFTRGVPDLKTLAIWVGGSDVAQGERLLEAVRAAFFGPFRVSVMLDSDGCNTTAAALVARLAKRLPLDGRRAVVIGLGPVGLRTATLLRKEGCRVLCSTIPGDLLGRPYRTPRGVAAARGLGLEVAEPADRAGLEAALEGAAVAVCAGPAGVQVLREALWRSHPSLLALLDCNAAEPLGIEGVKATDSLEMDGKLVMGALAIGGTKMKTHRACVASLFETNDGVLDAEGVYAVARGMA